MKTLKEVNDSIDEKKSLQVETTNFSYGKIKEMISFLTSQGAPLPYSVSQLCACFKSISGKATASLWIYEESYKIEIISKESADGLIVREEKEIICHYTNNLEEEHLTELAAKLKD